MSQNAFGNFSNQYILIIIDQIYYKFVIKICRLRRRRKQLPRKQRKLPKSPQPMKQRSLKKNNPKSPNQQKLQKFQIHLKRKRQKIKSRNRKKQRRKRKQTKKKNQNSRQNRNSRSLISLWHKKRWSQEGSSGLETLLEPSLMPKKPIKYFLQDFKNLEAETLKRKLLFYKKERQNSLRHLWELHKIHRP